MEPQYPNQPPMPTPTHPEIANPIASMMPDEQNLCQIARHPIGLLGIYTMAGLLIIVVAVLALIVAPDVFKTVSRTKVMSFGGLVLLVVALFTSLFVFISNKVYWGNRWVLTTDSLTQITQNSLFDKQSSQLSLGNLEDVTAEQNGPLTHMFNYGVLRVETAGERSKFMFNYCPNPNFYAQQILGAREAFEQKVRQAGGVSQGSYSQAPMSQPQPPVYGVPPTATVPLPPAPTPQPAQYPDFTGNPPPNPDGSANNPY